MASPDLNEIKRVAYACADAAAVATLRHFRQANLGLANKDKDHFDPVTLADKEAEAAIRAVLAKERPHDAILGEEQEAKSGTTDLTWVIDPIDGTRGYMSGTPTWGTLIAVSVGGEPVFGLVDQPYTKERFWGGGGVAKLDREGQVTDLIVREIEDLSLATLFSTYPEVGSVVERQYFEKVSELTRLVRFGTDCYAYALLAGGQIDLVIEAGLAPYDIQAPMALVQNAGGIVTDWHGQSPAAGGRVIAACCPLIHQQALQILAECP